MKTKREDIRNIAIIAHVDHGKTTLVDELLKQSGVFRENQEVEERVMDSNDIERERGITILSKNTAVYYKDTKINIIDTPGHADFGGEVERVLKMVNGVVLVVDAFEGAMPQTKFVLRKALDLNLPVIVCINKIDRPEARPDEVIDEVLELFMDLDASDDQLDCPFIYASAKSGIAVLDLTDEEKDMQPLFETILEYIPAPEGDPDASTQVLISTIDYNEYVGRIGVGKVDNGTIKVGMDAIVVNEHNPDRQEKVRISKLYEFDGLNKVDVKEATIGSIVAISGIADISIGDTICSPEEPKAIPFQKISEPTIAMQFIVNDSPFAGKAGTWSIRGADSWDDYDRQMFVVSSCLSSIYGRTASNSYYDLYVLFLYDLAHFFNFPYRTDASKDFVLPVAVGISKTVLDLGMTSLVSAAGADE